MTALAEIYPSDRPARAGLVAFGLVLAALAAWASVARPVPALVAAGEIAGEPGTIALALPEGGAVVAVYVAEGEAVRPGQVLVQFDNREARAALALTGQQIARQEIRLAAARSEAAPPGAAAPADPALGGLAAAQRGLLAANRASARIEDEADAARLAEIDASEAALKDQARLLQQQLEMVSSRLGQLKELGAKGLAGAAELQAQRQEEARLQMLLATVRSNQAAARGQRAELAAAAERRASARSGAASADLRDLEDQLAELRLRQSLERERFERLALRAPAAGVITALAVQPPGGVLRPGEPALTLVPAGQRPVARIRVPAGRAAELRPGQAARLMSPGPLGPGPAWVPATVLEMAPVALRDEHGAAFVTVRLSLGADPPDWALRPGLPVTASFDSPAPALADWVVSVLLPGLRQTLSPG